MYQRYSLVNADALLETSKETGWNIKGTGVWETFIEKFDYKNLRMDEMLAAYPTHEPIGNIRIDKKWFVTRYDMAVIFLPALQTIELCQWIRADAVSLIENNQHIFSTMRSYKEARDRYEDKYHFPLYPPDLSCERYKLIFYWNSFIHNSLGIYFNGFGAMGKAIAETMYVLQAENLLFEGVLDKTIARPSSVGIF